MTIGTTNDSKFIKLEVPQNLCFDIDPFRLATKDESMFMCLPFTGWCDG